MAAAREGLHDRRPRRRPLRRDDLHPADRHHGRPAPPPRSARSPAPRSRCSTRPTTSSTSRWWRRRTCRTPGMPDLAALAERLRAICGDAHVLTQRHQLRTYESDGLLHYAVTPGVVVLPADGDEVRRVVRACFEAAGAVRRPRRRLRALRRRAAGGRRRRDRAQPPPPRPARRPRQPARDGGARGDEPRGVAGGRADPLLPARPEQPGRLHDRRQRGRELRRRALPQVRLHDELRHRGEGGPLRRDRGAARRRRGRPARLRPARRGRRQRGDARRRHRGHAARGAGARRRCARSSPSSTARARPARRCRRSRAPASSPARSR